MLSLSATEFTVEEITPQGIVLEKNKQFKLGEARFQEWQRDYFTHFVLQKKDWTTHAALEEMARKMGVKPSRFDFAGTKDRNATTTQLCSAFAIAPERLVGVSIKDIQINGAWKAGKKVRLGELEGNRFTMLLNAMNCGVAPSAAAMNEKTLENNFFFPNYYGEQRFGSLRHNSHLVGELLAKGDAKGAVMNFLCFVDEGEQSESKEARKRLAEEKDFAAALEYFPDRLTHEKKMLEWLAKNSSDYAGAYRTMHRSMQLLFVHAHQSFLFNKQLAKMEEKKEKLEEIVLEPLQLQSFPELSSAGTARKAFVEMKEFSCEQKEEGVEVRFVLPAGSYATVAAEWLLGMLKPFC